MELNLGSRLIKNKHLVLLITGIIIFSSFFSSCYYDTKEELFGVIECDTVGVSYTVDILPILVLECYKCHDDEHAVLKGGSNYLEGYSKLFDFIEPGDAENSVIYQAVAWIPGTSFMPKGSSQLSACDIALLKSWIENGASEN